MDTLINDFKYVISNEYDDVFLIMSKDDIDKMKDYIKKYRISDFDINRLKSYITNYYKYIKVKKNTFTITILQIWKKETVAYLPTIISYSCDIKNKTSRCKNIRDEFESFEDVIEHIFDKESVFFPKQTKINMKDAFINKINNMYTNTSDAYYFEIKFFY